MLKKQSYINSAGDTLYIDLFKFYISNVSVKTDGKWKTIPSVYHLVNAEEAGSKHLQLPLGEKETIDSLRFTIGVDSLTCVSANMNGDLDPLKAMYWSWNTGYVNAKIEGRSSSCKTVHHAFEFHIGGYRHAFNSLRTVTLKVNHPEQLTLKANAAAWFNGKEKIRLSTTTSIVDVGRQAVMMADNYKDMFEILP